MNAKRLTGNFSFIFLFIIKRTGSEGQFDGDTGKKMMV